VLTSSYVILCSPLLLYPTVLLAIRQAAASPEVVEALGFEEVAQEFIEEYKANGTLYTAQEDGG